MGPDPNPVPRSAWPQKRHSPNRPTVSNFPNRALLFPILLAWSCLIASAQQKAFPEQIGSIGVNREPITWLSPESVIRDLRSRDKAVRQNAMHLVGVNQDFPNEVDLRYTTFSYDQQAVAVVSIEHSSFQYAAIAILAGRTWKRLAVFECWCKSEGAPLTDLLQVAPVLTGKALVLQIIVRASSGGTGFYEQTEAWFRLRDRRLEPVLSLIRRRSDCGLSSDPCVYQGRWFDGNQLIEGQDTSSEFQQDDVSDIRRQLLGWAVDDNAIKSFTCTPYKWDAANFKYTPSGPAHPCKYEPPK
jgi:hypothetical protein